MPEPLVVSVSKSDSQKHASTHQLMKKPKNFLIFQDRVDNDISDDDEGIIILFSHSSRETGFMQCFIMLNHITFSLEIKNA
jgi:hypothetical protein